MAWFSNYNYNYTYSKVNTFSAYTIQLFQISKVRKKESQWVNFPIIPITKKPKKCKLFKSSDYSFDSNSMAAEKSYNH